jgi:hypothetical protein
MALSTIPSPTGLKLDKVGADFLRIDSQVALTFSGIALAATDKETRRRALTVARKAHDTVLRLMNRFELTHSQREKLDSNLQRLQTELRSLGQII